MPGETYGGPYFGDRTILVFDGNGNYLNRNILGFKSDAVFLRNYKCHDLICEIWYRNFWH